MGHGYHHFPYQALSADGLTTSFSRTFRWDSSWIFGPTEGRYYEQENGKLLWKLEGPNKKSLQNQFRWSPPILESFSLILLDIELQQKGKLIEFLCLSSIFRARIKCAFCHNCFALSHFLGGGLIVCGPCWAMLQQPMRRPSWASRTFSMLPPSHPSSSEERRGCKTPK